MHARCSTFDKATGRMQPIYEDDPPDHEGIISAGCVLEDPKGGDVWCVNVFRGGWVFVPENVEGREFFEIDFSRQCKGFLGDNFAMVKHIADLRNQKVAQLTAESALHGDPNEPKPLKRELVGRIPHILTINVVTAAPSTEIEVAVLRSWQAKEMPHIELTRGNLQLLLMKPAESAPFGSPWIWHEIRKRVAPDVTWYKNCNLLACEWWDSAECKNKFESIEVITGCDVYGEQGEELITTQARDLQSWFEDHHALEDDAPMDDRLNQPPPRLS